MHIARRIWYQTVKGGGGGGGGGGGAIQPLVAPLSIYNVATKDKSPNDQWKC